MNRQEMERAVYPWLASTLQSMSGEEIVEHVLNRDPDDLTQKEWERFSLAVEAVVARLMKLSGR